MASIVSDPNGRRRPQFVAPDGSRKTIRLGKCDQKTAESICRHVEALLSARLAGEPIPRATAAWLEGIGDKLRNRLERAGLVEPTRSQVPTLAELIATYQDHRSDIKPATRIQLTQAGQKLLAYFGPDRPIDRITEADAENYYRFLMSLGLAHNTARRHAGRAKQYFTYAVRSRWISHNPFAVLKTATGGNPERQVYIPVEVIHRVLEACPTAEWRLIVALCRFAGLRCPSEHLALTWGDILWDRDRFVVQSAKTEHHPGKGQRIVPIFPELRPYLEEAFELAEPGAVYVITRNRGDGGMLNGIAVNWRTQFLRILHRAGIQPWPKLFHALRASCQTTWRIGSRRMWCASG
jgi:integrase